RARAQIAAPLRFRHPSVEVRAAANESAADIRMRGGQARCGACRGHRKRDAIVRQRRWHRGLLDRFGDTLMARTAPARKRRPPTSLARPRQPLPPRRLSTPVVARPADASARSTRTLEFLLQVLPIGWRGKARDYLVLVRMDRPIGALLLLWPTWWALWLAAGDFPPWKPLIIFTLGVFAMRAAGCAINDYADRHLDPQVARTAGRPIAAGRVTPREALIVFASLLVFSFLLVLMTNALTIKLSFIGAALAALYPFTKRYTDYPQVVLGAAFGWAIP